MSFITKLLTVSLTFFLFAATSFGQNGLSLLTIEAGARPAGMAGAFSSISGEPNGSFYNPAVARGSDKFLASFGHNTFLESIRLETGYFIAPFGSRTTLHGGIRFAKVSDLEFRNGPSSSPISLFDANDASFKIGITHDFSKRFSAGISGGWFIEKIEAWRGSAFNVDLGVLASLSRSLNFGASVTNLGSDLTLSNSGFVGSREIPLPTTYRAGFSYRHKKVLGAADFVVADDQGHLHLGAETALQQSFSLRAGVMTGYDSKNFTAGTSFVRRNITIDYAFVPFTNELGTSHLFNLTFGL